MHSLDLFRFTFVAELSNNQVLTLHIDKPGIKTECVFVSLNGTSQHISTYLKAMLEQRFIEGLECALVSRLNHAKL